MEQIVRPETKLKLLGGLFEDNDFERQSLRALIQEHHPLLDAMPLIEHVQVEFSYSAGMPQLMHTIPFSESHSFAPATNKIKQTSIFLAFNVACRQSLQTKFSSLLGQLAVAKHLFSNYAWRIRCENSHEVSPSCIYIVKG